MTDPIKSKTVDKKRAARRIRVRCRICGRLLSRRWWETPVCAIPCERTPDEAAVDPS